LVCAAISHDLTRAAGALASTFHAGARTGTIRAQLINTPAWPGASGPSQLRRWLQPLLTVCRQGR